MEKWSLAGEKSNWEPICSISKIQSFCCIPKIANKSLLSFLDIQMCFISSFTSERVDLPEDEREESVAMAEGYNYIKTLPSKQWAITLPRTLRSPACARARLLSLQRAFTYFPERGWHLGRDVLSQTWFLLTLSRVPSARSPSLPQWWNDIPTAAAGYEPKISVTNSEKSPSWRLLWKSPPFHRITRGSGSMPPEQTHKGQQWMPSHEHNNSYLARDRIKKTPVYNQ